MKKKLLLVFCLYFLLYPLSIGNAGEKWSFDGYDWVKWTNSIKVAFLRGWSVGGVVAAKWVYVDTAFAKMNFEDLDKYKKIGEGVLKRRGFEFDDLTYRQVVDTIDKIYSDPRVKTWEIQEIMPLVRGRLKEGWTEKDLDEVIAYNIKFKEWGKKLEEKPKMDEKEKEEFKLLISNEPKVLRALETYKSEW